MNENSQGFAVSVCWTSASLENEIHPLHSAHEHSASVEHIKLHQNAFGVHEIFCYKEATLDPIIKWLER
jgi:hypothetical protein